jgi:cytochrome c biogenesis protein CcdA
MFMLPSNGKAMSFWRLDPPFRFVIYVAVAVLFATGVGWVVADQMKDSVEGEFWQQAGATLLMVHGGTSMLTLALLGALFPVHICRAWRAGKNRGTGFLMLAVTGLLVATAFALYYLGSETIRSWSSGLHIAFGLGLPAVLLLHIKVGRRRTEPNDRRDHRHLTAK